MRTIPKPLESLVNYAQWITWSFVQKPGQPKPSKVPTDPITGEAIDPHNPRNWMTAADALATDRPVGFVLTANDPFFFVDVDNCVTEGGQWSDLAQETCAMFDGAAIEVSQSGRGLHVIACGNPPPGYGNRNDKIGAEFYTQDRFIALAIDNPCQGDAWTDHSTALSRWVPTYMKSRAEVSGNAGWTTAPRPEWNGSVDDEVLLQKMLSSGGVSSYFGGKATVRHLWEADADALGEFFPDAHGDRPYDASAADAALMSHLAFWTGCDCERMDRLFRRSGLMREKYDSRPDYQQRTILGAVGRCDRVYTAGTPATAATTEVGAPVSAGGGSGIMTTDDQLKYFENCCYVASLHKIFMPNGEFLKPEAFKARMGGHHFIIDIDGKTTKSAFEAFTENRVVQFPKVDKTCFRPEMGGQAIIEEDGKRLLSTYIPPNVIVTNDDPSPFITHLEKLFPDRHDREIVVSYMAAVVQHPGVKFQWCPVIQGAEGNGKSVFMRCVAHAVGTNYSHFPNAQDLGGNGGKFNAWVEGKIFIGIEEVYTRDRFEVIETLKPLVTNDRIEIQGKGSDQYTGDNRANFIMCTNHKDAIVKSLTDRRYAIFYTPQQSPQDFYNCGMVGDYFPNLYDWLRNRGGYGAVAGFLGGYKIPGEYNPAGRSYRAPITTSTSEALSQSFGAVEQEVMEAVESGLDGFRGGWISSYHLDKLLTEVGMQRRVARNKRRIMLQSLGYFPHPALPNGRSTVEIFGENARPVLYIHSAAPDNRITEAGQAVQSYLVAQRRA